LHLPELEQNRVGYELGTRWVREHPRDMAALSIRKLVYLFGADDFGAYYAIYRGTGNDDKDTSQAVSSSRMTAFRVAALVSLVFWLLILAACLRALVVWWNQRAELRQLAYSLPLIYLLLYSTVVFSVFESGSRQHMVATAPLLPLAAAGFCWSVARN